MIPSMRNLSCPFLLRLRRDIIEVYRSLIAPNMTLGFVPFEGHATRIFLINPILYRRGGDNVAIR